MRHILFCLFLSINCTSYGAEPTILKFSDIFIHPINDSGLQFSPKVLSVNGQRILIKGYMVQQESGVSVGHFLLTPIPVKLSEHADGEADDLPPTTLLVRLSDTQSDWQVPFVPGILQLEGVLYVGRHEDKKGKVSWIQLELDTQSTREMSSFEITRQFLQRFHTH